MEDIHHYQDKTYKLLFSHPKIIKDLLRGNYRSRKDINRNSGFYK